MSVDRELATSDINLLLSACKHMMRLLQPCKFPSAIVPIQRSCHVQIHQTHFVPCLTLSTCSGLCNRISYRLLFQHSVLVLFRNGQSSRKHCCSSILDKSFHPDSRRKRRAARSSYCSFVRIHWTFNGRPEVCAKSSEH